MQHLKNILQKSGVISPPIWDETAAKQNDLSEGPATVIGDYFVSSGILYL